MKPGTVSFLLPHHMHFIVRHPDSAGSGHRIRKICCMFDLQLLSNIRDNSWFSRQLYNIGTATPSFVDFSDEESKRVLHVFLQLVEEYKKPDSPFRLEMIRTKLNEAVLMFLRSAIAQPYVDATSITPSKTERTGIVWLLLRYINSHYTEPLTLKELPSHFQLSEPYISRIFKEQIRIGFTEYIHRLRIERSMNMPLHTDMTITEIAFEVGFESTRTFSRVFREVKGISAKEYRLAFK